jgi:FkbM family methyltransferase
MEYNGESTLLNFVLLNTPNQCPIVFDVGANAGDWSAEAYRINPKIQLHCFEPSAKTFDRLSETLVAMNPILNRLALGKESGYADFYTYENSLLSSFVHWHPQAQYVRERVNVETLDTYTLNHHIEAIDLLKIDVEGYDLHVLQGAQSLLERAAVDVIQFEYGPANIYSRILLRDVFHFIQPFPYDIYQIHPRHIKHLPKYNMSLECFQLSNFVIINRQLRYRYQSYIRE